MAKRLPSTIEDELIFGDVALGVSLGRILRWLIPVGIVLVLAIAGLILGYLWATRA
jgi:hypothetical protein